MNYERLEKSRVKASFTVTKEEFATALDSAFITVNANVTIKGFRKGKASKAMYLKNYGVESLYSDAIDLIVNKKLEEDVFTNTEFRIVGRPSLDLDYASISAEAGFDFSVTFDVSPEVVVGTYKGIEVAAGDLTVTDGDVNKEIQSKLNEKVELVVKSDGVLANGDTAVFDFVGSVDGVEFPGGSAENFELKIGSGQFIPGFEEQMVGMTTAGERDINVVFPESYQEQTLAGKPALFKVKLHEVKENVYPELTDELVAEFAIEGVVTVADFKGHVVETLSERKKQNDKQRIENEIMAKLVESSVIDLPKTYVDNQKANLKRNVENQAKQYNIPLEMLLQFSGMTVEQFEAQTAAQAVNDVKVDLILEEVSKLENFEVSDEEINNNLKENAANYNMSEEELLKKFGRENIAFSIKAKKAYDLVISSAVVK